MRRRRRPLKKLPCAPERSPARHHRGHTDRDLVSGRGQSRTEGIAQLRLGAGWLTPADGARQLHLDEISTQVAPGSIAAVICDGAGWHQSSGELRLPVNIVLLPLPPYAPELNSMENVWDYLRANKFSACVWDSYDEILAACADAWNWFTDDPERIRSIGARDWATVNV